MDKLKTNHTLVDLPRGQIVHRRLSHIPKQEYLAYIPRVRASDMRVLVSIHGLARNSKEQLQQFSNFCEPHGVALLAPIFTAEHHADYQRLGRLGRGVRADLALNECLDEMALLTGADTSKIHLFGYSGGAQFAHRYLMAHPHRVAGAIITAAGWYTFPDTRRKFPYGILSTRRLPQIVFNPEKFLRVPITVLIGDQDIGHEYLRNTQKLNQQQGNNRLERARKWVATMCATAEAYGLKPRVSYQEIAGVNHSFREFCQNGALPERVFHTLFGNINGKLTELKKRESQHSDPRYPEVIHLSKKDIAAGTQFIAIGEGH